MARHLAQIGILGRAQPAVGERDVEQPAEQVLEIGAGGVLVARVASKLISRTQGVMVSSGELGFEPATRRIRGQQSEEIFGSGDARLFVVTGEGYMVASSCGEVFTAVLLEDDILYLREEYVFAFDRPICMIEARSIVTVALVRWMFS